jgi:hypothetical protein
MVEAVESRFQTASASERVYRSRKMAQARHGFDEVFRTQLPRAQYSSPKPPIEAKPVTPVLEDAQVVHGGAMWNVASARPPLQSSPHTATLFTGWFGSWVRRRSLVLVVRTRRPYSSSPNTRTDDVEDEGEDGDDEDACPDMIFGVCHLPLRTR